MPLLMRIAFVALGVGLIWPYAALFRAPASGSYHDDGVYLVTARALAEGEGYRIISLPDEPVQTKYPVLFPFLLSLIWRAFPSFPDNLLWLRTVPLLSTLAWLYLSWRLITRCGASRATALTIVGLTAVSPAVAYFGNTLLTESLFAALLTGSLLCLVSALDGGSGRWRMCAFDGLLAGASFLTRAAGVAVVAAGLAWLLSRRRWVDAAAFAIAAGALAAPWLWWGAANASAASDAYHSASVYGAQGGWNVVFSYGWREKLAVVGMNIGYVALTPFSLWGQQRWLVVPCLLAVPFVIRGLWLGRAHPVTWCVVGYLAMVCLWVWPPTRLVVPVVPLILWQIGLAIPGRVRVVAAAVAAAMMVSAAGALCQLAREAPVRVIAWPRHPEHPDGWRQLDALYGWIRRSTPPDAVLIGDLDPTYFLYTGRKAIRTFEPDGFSSYYDTAAKPGLSGMAAVFRRRALAAGAGFWVWSEGPNDSGSHSRLRDEVTRTHPGSLSIAAGDSESGYAVYRIDRERLERAEGP